MHPKRHNRTLFVWLVRRAVGTSRPIRGVVDAATGNVAFWQRYRPIKWPRRRHKAKAQPVLALAEVTAKSSKPGVPVL